MAVKTEKPEAAAADGKEGQVEEQRKVDPRLDWFEDRVCKALKLKNDKWRKLVYIQENWYFSRIPRYSDLILCL